MSTALKQPEELSTSFHCRLELELGLIGLPDIKNLEVCYTEEEAPFFRLNDMGESALSFFAVDPYFLIPNYNPKISQKDLNFLKINDSTDSMLLSIAVVKDEPIEVSINLIGPVLINLTDGKAKQIILENSDEFSARHVVFSSAI